MNQGLRNRISGYIKINREDKEFRERLFALDTTSKEFGETYKSMAKINKITKIITAPLCVGAAASLIDGNVAVAIMLGKGALISAITVKASSNGMELNENLAIYQNTMIFAQKIDKEFEDFSEGRVSEVKEEDPQKDSFEKLLFGDEFKLR